AVEANQRLAALASCRACALAHSTQNSATGQVHHGDRTAAVAPARRALTPRIGGLGERSRRLGGNEPHLGAASALPGVALERADDAHVRAKLRRLRAHLGPEARDLHAADVNPEAQVAAIELARAEQGGALDGEPGRGVGLAARLEALEVVEHLRRAVALVQDGVGVGSGGRRRDPSLLEARVAEAIAQRIEARALDLDPGRGVVPTERDQDVANASQGVVDREARRTAHRTAATRTVERENDGRLSEA